MGEVQLANLHTTPQEPNTDALEDAALAAPRDNKRLSNADFGLVNLNHPPFDLNITLVELNTTLVELNMTLVELIRHFVDVVGFKISVEQFFAGLPKAKGFIF